MANSLYSQYLIHINVSRGLYLFIDTGKQPILVVVGISRQRGERTGSQSGSSGGAASMAVDGVEMKGGRWEVGGNDIGNSNTST